MTGRRNEYAQRQVPTKAVVMYFYELRVMKLKNLMAMFSCGPKACTFEEFDRHATLRATNKGRRYCELDTPVIRGTSQTREATSFASHM